jgi:adenosylhomocysteine nucleosidase
LIDESEETIGQFAFYTGQIAAQEIILLRSNIGKANAAAATALLLQLHQPDVVINTGSAGGFHPTLAIGDVVISSALQYHDVDVTASDYDYGQVPGMPTQFFADDKLVQIAMRCAAKINSFRTIKGLIATGDAFMEEAELVDNIRRNVSTIYAAEMESAAIAQICRRFQVPFVAIRAISDLAAQDAHATFEQHLQAVSDHAATLVLAMVKELSK